MDSDFVTLFPNSYEMYKDAFNNFVKKASECEYLFGQILVTDAIPIDEIKQIEHENKSWILHYRDCREILVERLQKYFGFEILMLKEIKKTIQQLG